MNRKKMAQISGFLPQSDVILDGITVREHLNFMVSYNYITISVHLHDMIFFRLD